MASAFYESVRRLYLSGSLDEAGLDVAVTKRRITAAEAEQLRAEKAQTEPTQ